MLDLYNEFKQIVNKFKENSIEYAICGGLAVTFYGYVRATVDIDMLVLSEDMEESKKALREIGYSIEATPMELSAGKIHIERLTKVDKESGDYLPIDLMIVTDSIRHIWQSRKQVQALDMEIQVVDKKGLIELKRMRNSAIDQEDILKLEESDE
ncbi:MAG TPA: nucleotidyltransferase family protein [Leptospiraceae bacterium]|nr:nucleotidyltransferase family protein [Leptospiraceae bacterium]HMW08301.1 nucleotidyltransferase family protein [Leptospiraceae bacterium]HMX33840.1 nucleotidyltransferase family protein [Leptospiraceae bacterium]HMY34192.1 nucleotidyltransferase family protein [Leptospiraceae bacterium]HMZ67056.1 nucleotidyltransferase family protein [Leptospiraceae bacterium]